MSATGKPGTQVVTGELHRVRRGRGKGFSAVPPPELSHRPARVAVMLALAHMIQRAIDRGEIRDQADAARRLGVTRARVTQIVDLVFLAPDLQEEILFFEAMSDKHTIRERALRGLTRVTAWTSQRGRSTCPHHFSNQLLGV